MIERLDRPTYIKSNVRCDMPWHDMIALRDELRERFPAFDFVFPTLHGPFIDILPHGWSKGRAVKVLAEHLGITLDEVTRQYPGVLELGSTGNGVLNLQYFIAYLSQFYDTIPAVAIDGRFGESTRAAVQAVQRTFGLPPDGIVGERTWYELYRAYVGIVNTIPLEYVSGYTVPYGGVPLRIGAESESVRLLQEYLNYIAQTYTEIPQINPTGYFGPRTQEAVIAFQNRFGFTPTGVVSAVTWTAITELYNALYKGVQLQDGQFPGFAVGG
jgi:peptidoglycan hydrolase-like protein with peptidoglycan-binding domain